MYAHSFGDIQYRKEFWLILRIVFKAKSIKVRPRAIHILLILF